MEEVKQRPICHRAEDLVTYLYGEATAAEALDFGKHLQQCDACRGEFAVFNQLHDSIVTWRNEALGATFDSRAVAIDSTVESRQFVRHGRKLPALAALREFFTVSPLWLRGATAFAALLLCALIVLVASRTWQRDTSTTLYDQKFENAVNNRLNEKLTELNRQRTAVEFALDKTTSSPSAPQISSFSWNTTPTANQNFSGTITGTNFVAGTRVWFCVNGTNTCYQPRTADVAVSSSTQLNVSNVNLSAGLWQLHLETPDVKFSPKSVADARPPARIKLLTRQEREQLAADLRLTNPAEEEEMQLALPEQDQQRPNQ